MTVPLTESELADIDKAAHARDMSRSAFVRLAVKQQLEVDAA